MKYAIYDKAADGYLTKMDFITDIPDTALGLQCEYNEYITEAKLLDTKEEAVAVVTRIESFKFMETGRFVIHSFDDELGNQYIISEAGNPTKVVDNITVDLSGTINVKYGTMACHWSTTSLIYVINKLNKLQDASAPARYCSWNATFDIYKVITITDERECTHYQFINVTDKGIVSAKDEANPLTKRIEELEISNNELRNDLYGSKHEISRLRDKIESIKREARNWKNLYENADNDRSELKNWIDFIYNDLKSAPDCDDLKSTLDALKLNTKLNHIYMPTKASYILDKGNALTVKDEIYAIVDTMITIMMSRELNKACALSSAEEVKCAKELADCIIDICEADDKFEVTLNKFSELYEAVNSLRDNDDTIMHAFKDVLEIFSSLEDKVRKIIDESVEWKFKAQTAEKALDDRKKLNKANVDTISRLADEKRDMNKEIKELRTMRDCLAEIIRAIRNAICDNNSGAFDCIDSRMIHDSDFNSGPFMAGARENIKDICDAAKRNIANYAFKCRELSKSAKELSDAVDALEEVNDKNEGLTNMLKEITDCIADIMVATNTLDTDKMISNLRGVSCKIGVKTIDDGPMYGLSIILSTLIINAKAKADWKHRAEEAICDYTKCNEALGEWKRKCKAKDADYEGLTNKLKACEVILESTQNSLTVMTKERDEALELKEMYKRQANSVYGMTIPCRCNGKQMFYDVTTGKKILVDKEKYDDLVECVNNINITYDILKCADWTMNKPLWFDGVINRIKNLTK